MEHYHAVNCLLLKSQINITDNAGHSTAFEAFNNLEELDLSLNGINHVISQNGKLSKASYMLGRSVE